MAAWPKILVKNVFRPAGSGEFCAVMEVEGKRSIMKTGDKFGRFEVKSIDGVKKCVAVFKLNSREKEEFCKENWKRGKG